MESSVDNVNGRHGDRGLSTDASGRKRKRQTDGDRLEDKNLWRTPRVIRRLSTDDEKETFGIDCRVCYSDVPEGLSIVHEAHVPAQGAQT